MRRSVIEGLLQQGFCQSCGTCAGCCPQNAIRMRIKGHIFVPEVDDSMCQDCDICVKACPRLSDLDALNKFVFGKSIEDIELGNFLKCYIGYSTNPQMQWTASSGGLVSTLLSFALEKGMIDGAIVTRMNKKQPLTPEVVIARSKEEILEASKSKYCPVCVNEKLREVLESEGKYAIVGLPCHIQGARTAETILKQINKRIYLHLGLFCLHNITFNGTYFMLEKLGIERRDIKSLDYRGQGWPGRISVELKNGEKKSFSYQYVWSALFGAFFFSPLACTTCSDMTSELSDISFGDAWLPELKNAKQGVSMLIVRTERGKSLLEEAEKKGKIRIKEINREKVLEAHKLGIYFKKKNLSQRLTLLNSLGYEITMSRNPKLMSSGIMDHLLAPFPYLNIRVSTNPYLVNFLKHVPISLLGKYTLVFNLMRKLALCLLFCTACCLTSHLLMV